MPRTPADPPPSPLRLRRRAGVIAEIVAAANVQIARDGPDGLSMRGIARDLAMTAQGLYHYFPSKQDLVTVLVSGAYDAFADAIEQAVASRGHGHEGQGFVVAAEAYRHWALENPEHFALIYGTPLRHYAAPHDGSTTAAARRISAIFARGLFGDLPRDRLDAPEGSTGAMSPELRARLDGLPPGSLGDLPAPPGAAFLSCWGHLHGLVSLEVFGHLGFVAPYQAEVFRRAMTDLYAHARGNLPGPGPDRTSVR